MKKRFLDLVSKFFGVGRINMRESLDSPMIYRNALEYLSDPDTDSYFSPNEWPVPEDLQYVHAEVLYNLDKTRHAFGAPVFPSGFRGGLVRRSGSTTSRHYIGDGSLGEAVDVFPSVDVLDFWLLAVENTSWRGIGVYLDTNVNRRQPQPMVHLDIGRREHGNRVFWVRNNGKYIYKYKEPDLFWELLAEASKR